MTNGMTHAIINIDRDFRTTLNVLIPESPVLTVVIRLTMTYFIFNENLPILN